MAASMLTPLDDSTDALMHTSFLVYHSVAQTMLSTLHAMWKMHLRDTLHRTDYPVPTAQTN
jgi:hypothetical protein